ncbi:hypothetical protein KIN20_034065 [Parelaphostrongylus tenuis]|uniref:Uncharacterized protein n=1 Tax=Parelaphostrongylus tenuis TaxID=148309 RepID=A0AAD5R9T5_PARTN|nr:hypothetical protein KIN20_034065 [Parelaphostrongylus tenuis]
MLEILLPSFGVIEGVAADPRLADFCDVSNYHNHSTERLKPPTKTERGNNKAYESKSQPVGLN